MSPEPLLPATSLARDLMTSPVIVAAPETTVRELAEIMFKNNLGALPVVDAAGTPIGIVSDGDLFGRRPEDKRHAWWLGLLARNLSAPDLPERERQHTARDLMSTPLLTATPTTPAPMLAEILQLQHIKRLPVVDGGKLVGIVSRSDLLKVVKTLPQEEGPSLGAKTLEFMESLIGGASLSGGVVRHAALAPPEPAPLPTPEDFSASALRSRVRAFQAEKTTLREAQSAASHRDRQIKVKALLEEHLSAHLWRTLIEHAEAAAEQGEKELLMLRFPAALCIDGGRAIDVAEPGWEATLRGEAAEFYARWRDELRPHGFRLSARVVSYDADGVIGDVGLYLVWGE